MRRKGFFAQFFSLQLFWIFDKMGVLNFFFKKIPDFLGFCLTGELWLNCVLKILENYNNSIFWGQQKISCQNFQIFWRQNQWKKFRKKYFFCCYCFFIYFFWIFSGFFYDFFFEDWHVFFLVLCWIKWDFLLIFFGFYEIFLDKKKKVFKVTTTGYGGYYWTPKMA